MAREARYRASPMTEMPDGQVSDEQLSLEARKYADMFLEDQDARFYIGPPELRVQRALVYTIEAGRRLCNNNSDHIALTLLNMAAAEIDSGRQR